MGRKKNKQNKGIVSNSERIIPDTLNTTTNLQDTLMELSDDESNRDFEKRVQLLNIPSQIDKLIHLIKVTMVNGKEYTIINTLPFNINNIFEDEYPQLAEYLSKILGIGVYYYPHEDVWVFYWHDTSQCGDSLPYPEISENELDSDLDLIEKGIKLHKRTGNEMCYYCKTQQKVRYYEYNNYYGNYLKYNCECCRSENNSQDEGACEYYDKIPYESGGSCNLM